MPDRLLSQKQNWTTLPGMCYAVGIKQGCLSDRIFFGAVVSLFFIIWKGMKVCVFCQRIQEQTLRRSFNCTCRTAVCALRGGWKISVTMAAFVCDIRDSSGVVQIVLHDDKMLDGVTRESVVSCDGPSAFAARIPSNPRYHGRY
jgi:hypothetical protein